MHVREGGVSDGQAVLRLHGRMCECRSVAEVWPARDAEAREITRRQQRRGKLHDGGLEQGAAVIGARRAVRPLPARSHAACKSARKGHGI